MIKKILSWVSCNPMSDLDKEYIEAVLDYWESIYKECSKWYMISNEEKLEKDKTHYSIKIEILINALNSYDIIKKGSNINVQMEYKSIYYKKLVNTLIKDKYIFDFMFMKPSPRLLLSYRILTPFNDVSSFKGIDVPIMNTRLVKRIKYKK